MTTADVDPTAPPDQRRCTAQAFMLDVIFRRVVLPDPTLRISDNSDWPPAILFDAVYAGAVLAHFGTRAVKDHVSTAWKDIFYPGGVIMTAAQAGHQADLDQRASEARRNEGQKQDRQARDEARSAPDTFDMLMALPYIRVPVEQLKMTMRGRQERAEEMDRRRVEEKVETWIKQITAT